MLALFAYAYDNLENLKIVLTGSEVGLLHDFLGINDYESPLYGRVAGEVYVEPFDLHLSKEFLKAGFREVNLNVEDEIIEKAIEMLDGIPGWLVLFGVEYMREKDYEKAMKRTFEVAKGLILGELRELEKRSRRYLEILRGIALGYNRWSLIRDYLAVKGIPTPEPRLYELLNNLKKMGWINEVEGKYILSDPLVKVTLTEWKTL